MSLLRFVCALVFGSIALPAFAAVPGSIEVTCDVDRAAFRSAARSLPVGGNVTFHVYNAPAGGTASSYVVPAADLQVFKAFTEKFDSVNKRKSARIDARIGDDGNPVMLPANGVAWLVLEVGASTLGCDFAATASLTARRRLHSVAFSRESNHSETCETCTTAQGTRDVSARVFNSADITVPDSVNSFYLSFDSEHWDTDNIHDTTTNPTRLTAQTAGKYMIKGYPLRCRKPNV